MNNVIERIASFDKFGSVLGLERMEKILDILGNPQDDLKVIHVAGTNGKGSVCRFLYSVLNEAGYKTGLFMSPFIEVFNERIQLGGNYISDEELDDVFIRVKAASDQMIESGFQSPTEFEIVTAMAFLYFKEQKADYVILEVGLGGRGDSTNVVKAPLITAITSISFDHVDRLGDTVEKIAWEKAGIIKANCPVVLGVDNETALKVCTKVAQELDSQVIISDKSQCEIISETLDGTRFSVKGQNEVYEIPLLGRFQVSNCLIAIKLLNHLKDNNIIELTDFNILNGLKKANHMVRFEIISKDPLIVLDGGHNEAGSAALAETIEILMKNKKLIQVVGLLEDKDIKNIIGNLLKIGSDFIVTEPDNPRKMSKEQLSSEISSLGGNILGVYSTDEIIEKALNIAREYDGLIVTGSLYLLGKVRRKLNES